MRKEFALALALVSPFSVGLSIFSWPVNAQTDRPPLRLPGTVCIGGRTERSRLAREVQSNFEANSISSPVDVTIVFTEKNPVVGMVGAYNPRDEFYCTQAVWESLPNNATDSTPITVYLSKYFGNQELCTGKYFMAHPEHRNNCVVLHLIPSSVLTRYPKVLSVGDIHDVQNLVAVPINNVHGDLIDSFRNDWLKYFRQHNTTTKDDLLQFRAKLLEQYKALFAFEGRERQDNAI